MNLLSKLIIGSILIIGVGFISCTKKCETSSPCSESIPTGATCQAFFESWIYNPAKKSCEFKGYSGCNAIGFETKEECEKCDCK